MSSTKRAEVTIIKQILIRLKPIVQDSVISRQSAVITINQQSPISSRPQHTVSAISPQYKLSAPSISYPPSAIRHSISCQPAASAVRSQYQLSARSISYQPSASAVTSQHQPSALSISCHLAASAVNPQHQLLAVISRPQSSPLSHQLPTSDHRSSVIHNQAVTNHHLQPASY